MTNNVKFVLNDQPVEALPGETIWETANRLGINIPHLCYSSAVDYPADGNCRACMVEIKGERVLAASCIRMPTEGMIVSSTSDRANTARKMVFEMLVADQPDRDSARDPESKFWNWTSKIGIADSRLPSRVGPIVDQSHPAMRVNLDACIHCNLCVRACREVDPCQAGGVAGGHRGGLRAFATQP